MMTEMTHTPNPSDDVFANEDISELIAKAGIDARDLTTWSCTRPATARSTLRLVHQASRRRIDALCETYEDMRLNSFDRASDVHAQVCNHRDHCTFAPIHQKSLQSS